MSSVKKLGVMIDCSRNAVMRVDRIKYFMKIVRDMGYDYISLYFEDVFEVDNEPMFGYMRGRYSKEDLKDLDRYAVSLGLELLPCVQTLAHLNQIFRWKEYSEINDISDTLLVGNERTYRLIDNIFKTVSECFTSRRINIGMDEAHFAGRGYYLDKNGYTDRLEVLKRHLTEVNKIAVKYGFSPMMWSDMYFNKAKGGESYSSLDALVSDMEIPENLGLICWDYYHTDKEFYKNLLLGHKIFDRKVVYACSAYTSRGFAPNNAFSVDEIRAGIEASKECGIDEVLVTAWGGNGAECSVFSVLPSLFIASQIAKDLFNEKDYKEKFKEITGESFDAFMALDLPNEINIKRTNYGPSKLMLYNDLFTGIFDYIVKGGENEIYRQYARKLSEYARESKFAYIFNCLSSLCEVLSVKYELGVKTRKAYSEKDKKTLKGLVKEYSAVIEKIKKFYSDFKTAWGGDNKPFGFEIQDIRLGGLILRVEHLRKVLKDYLKGNIKEIPELKEKILNIETGKEESGEIPVFNDWKTNVSVNII